MAQAATPRPIRPVFLFSVLQLGTQVARQEYRPPFTLTVIAAQAIFFMRPSWLVALTMCRRATELYMIPAAVVEACDLRRFLVSCMVHSDSYHLYYNAGAMLWQGTQLEAKFGSRQFAKLVGTLLVSSHALFVSMTWLVSCFGFDRPYYSVSVGFSNVLFALKMVMCYELPGGVAQIFSFAVPMKTEMWAELFFNWLLVPQTSLVAHLSGIMAGFLYYEWRALLRSEWRLPALLRLALPGWVLRPLGLEHSWPGQDRGRGRHQFGGYGAWGTPPRSAGGGGSGVRLQAPQQQRWTARWTNSLASVGAALATVRIRALDLIHAGRGLISGAPPRSRGDSASSGRQRRTFQGGPRGWSEATAGIGLWKWVTGRGGEARHQQPQQRVGVPRSVVSPPVTFQQQRWRNSLAPARTRSATMAAAVAAAAEAADRDGAASEVAAAEEATVRDGDSVGGREGLTLQQLRQRRLARFQS